MIRNITGDLFDFPVIGHGCNTKGVMGAGVAGVMRNKYPEVYENYKKACDNNDFNLGDCLYVAANKEDGTWIHVFNLATQEDPGPNANISAIVVSVIRMLADAQENGDPEVFIPQIGCGIGGLKWEDVQAVLTPIADLFTTDLVVVTLPMPVKEEEGRDLSTSTTS